MGRSYTPTYRVEYRDNLLQMNKCVADKIGVEGKPCMTMAWSKRGKISEALLEEWRQTFNRSFQKGGVNSHISNAYNMIPHIFYAAIVRQSDNKLMVKVNAPAFEII